MYFVHIGIRNFKKIFHYKVFCQDPKYRYVFFKYQIDMIIHDRSFQNSDAHNELRIGTIGYKIM